MMTYCRTIFPWTVNFANFGVICEINLSSQNFASTVVQFDLAVNSVREICSPWKKSPTVSRKFCTLAYSFTNPTSLVPYMLLPQTSFIDLLTHTKCHVNLGLSLSLPVPACRTVSLHHCGRSCHCGLSENSYRSRSFYWLTVQAGLLNGVETNLD